MNREVCETAGAGAGTTEGTTEGVADGAAVADGTDGDAVAGVAGTGAEGAVWGCKGNWNMDEDVVVEASAAAGVESTKALIERNATESAANMTRTNAGL